MKLYRWSAVLWMAIWGVFFLFVGRVAMAQSGYEYNLSATGNDPAVVQAGVLLEAVTKLHPADNKIHVNFKATKSDEQTLIDLVEGRVAFGIVKGGTIRRDNQLMPVFERELRVVTLLWREVLHFLVKKQYLQSGTISDLRALPRNKILLGTTGFSVATLEDQVLMPLKLGGIAKQARDDYEGIIWLSGLPSAFVESVGSDWVFLDVLPAQKQQIAHSAWVLKTLRAGDYNNADTDINVFTQGVYLLSLATIDSNSIAYLLEALSQDCFGLTTQAPFDAQKLAQTTDFLQFHEGTLSYYSEASELSRGDKQKKNKERCR